MLRSQSFSLLRSALSPPSLWSRIFVATFVLLAGLSFTEQAQAQCASGFLSSWRLCASGSTLTEGSGSVITLSVTRGLGVAGVAADFTVGVPSSLATGANSSTVTISSSASTSTTASFIVRPANTSLYEGRRTFSLSASRTDSTEFASIAGLSGVINDDESPPSFTLSAMPTSWNESASSVSVSLTATLGSSIGKSLSVTFSASGTSDYSVSGSQTRTISQGSTSASASLTFTPVNDNVDEPNSRITINARSNDSGIGTASTTVTQFDNDTSEALAFSRTSVTVDEGSTATYTVALAITPSGNVTVSVGHSSGDPDITVRPSSLSFTTSNWSTGQTVTVEAAQDDDLSAGSARISHTASGGGYNGISGNVTATEDDDDTGSLLFSSPSVDVPEGGSDTYSVSLSHQPSSNVTVVIAKRTGGDTDISVKPASLTFTSTNWSTGQTVTVEAAQDDDGLNGTATISHTASGAEYQDVTASVTATEQDTDRKLLTSTSSLTVDEGSFTTYTVRLATQPTGTVTVAVSWLQGDADLSVTPAALTFTTGNWNTTQTVTVRAAEDNDLANGRATFWHSASGGGYDGVTVSVTAAETDNDTAQLHFSRTSVTVPEDDHATYTVRPRYAPTGTVSLSVAVEMGGDHDITVRPANLTFTTMDWSTAQTVTVSARDDDDAVNGSRQITHTAAGAEYADLTATVTATEQDDDEAGLDLSKIALTVAEGGTATYTVELATQPTATVTVLIVRSSGDTSITVLPASMTFTTSTWDDAQVVTVSAAEDTDGANSTATISHTASGGDYATVSADATVTESDNDTAGFTLSETALTVEEGGSDTYTVRLATQPSGSVTVTVAATGDLDITVPSDTLTFSTTTWSTPQTVIVSAAEDDDLADGTATIGHTATGGGYGDVTGSVTVTEDDNDAAGLVFSRTTLVVTEEATATYTVSLLSQPSQQVTVAIAKVADGDPDLSASPTPLTFTTTTWNTAQTVTVSATDDNDLADGTATFLHTAMEGDYADITRSLTATERDNDTGELDFSTTALNVPEAGTATYTMRLKFQPTATVAVLLAHSTGDPDITVNPPAVVFTPANWAVARTVTLTAASDNDLANGMATIAHTAIGGGYDGVTGDVTATEQDDDTGQLLFSKSSLTVPEGGSTTYTVTLAFQPTGTVTVSITDSGDEDISATTTSLSFTTVNWNSPKTVTISAAEDDDLANGGGTITHTPSGGGYANITPTLPATERDNDSGAFTFSMTALTVAEAGDTDYTVRLAYKPTATVTVSVAATGDPDLSATPPTLTFTTGNWGHHADRNRLRGRR